MNPDEHMGVGMRTTGWARLLSAALAISGFQVLFVSLAGLVWWKTKGSWGGGAFGVYFITLCVVTPIVAWNLVARWAKLRHGQWWRAWPVGVATLLVLVWGEGFDEAGAPVWAPLVAVWIFTLVSGFAALHGTPTDEPHTGAATRSRSQSQPPNKGMKLTSAERNGRSQLIPGVRQT